MLLRFNAWLDSVLLAGKDGRWQRFAVRSLGARGIRLERSAEQLWHNQQVEVVFSYLLAGEVHVRRLNATVKYRAIHGVDLLLEGDEAGARLMHRLQMGHRCSQLGELICAASRSEEGMGSVIRPCELLRNPSRQ